MKKYAYALGALMALQGLALATDAPAAAAPAKTHAAAPHAAEAKTLKARGEVVSVDAVGNTLTLKGRKGESTYAIGSGAKIMNGKKEATLADVTAGSRVVVAYSVEGKTMTASMVRIVPAKKAPAPAAASKK